MIPNKNHYKKEKLLVKKGSILQKKNRYKKVKKVLSFKNRQEEKANRKNLTYQNKTLIYKTNRTINLKR